MKNHEKRLFHALSVFLPVMGLFIGIPEGRAADDIILNTFDLDSEVAQWARWWGAAGQTYEFDGTVDADGNPNSGSLKATIRFDLAAYGGDNQFALLRSFSLTDGSQY